MRIPVEILSTPLIFEPGRLGQGVRQASARSRAFTAAWRCSSSRRDGSSRVH